jgi:tRNA-dihydrouridine synthase B
MAGLADAPLRQLWRDFGASHTVGEMTTADPSLRHSNKTRKRFYVDPDDPLPVIQLAGTDPQTLADAARHAQDLGARIIDINMGCPAKKVCQVAAGSALLRNETLVARILDAVVRAVSVPVTLKFRTGWSPESRNALTIGQLAEGLGIQMLTLHGRTRACGFRGQAEYDTVARLKSAVRIPVVVNGDITTPEQARSVLAGTGADAVMIGRAALREPWIFARMAAAIDDQSSAPSPSIASLHDRLLTYLTAHHQHHGDDEGTRMARKRIHFMLSNVYGGKEFCQDFMQIQTPQGQLDALEKFLKQSAARHPFFEYSPAANHPSGVHCG